jgi:hypothetical protein
MKNPWIAVVGLTFALTLASSCASANRSPANDPWDCPEIGVSETAIDCPYAGIARGLLAQVDPSDSSARTSPFLISQLDARLPVVTDQLRKDAMGSSQWFSLWGTSINFDEGARGIIVENALIDALLDLARGPNRQDRLVHAGVEHTYGYLFSLLKTSFGYKRARWVQGEIEKGFGISAGTFGPAPREGTLLSNVTHFAGRIALRDQASAQKKIDSISGIPNELRGYFHKDLKITRLTETVQSISGYSIRTDFVEFPNRPATGNTHLLIYSTLTSQGPQLITAFPVESGFVSQATKPADLGSRRPIKTRYNAYLSAITDAPAGSITGSRSVSTGW